MRRPSHATVVAYLALFVALGGTAAAATGGTFVLGRSNYESGGASLSTLSGSPLTLNAPTGKAPLAVNQRVQINNLNAQYVGGRTATQLGVRQMLSFDASNHAAVTGSNWQYVSSAPSLTFPDKTTAALVTGTVSYTTTDSNQAFGFVGVCSQAAGHAPTTVRSVAITVNPGMTVPATVSAVLTGLTGTYSVGLCAKLESANVAHSLGEGSILVSETTSP